MHYALDRFAAEVWQAIAASGTIPGHLEHLIDVQVPKANVPADLSFPAFRAAKEMGSAPPALAATLAAAIAPGSETLIGSVVAAGPFLNFTLHPQHFAAAVLREIDTHGARYGHDDIGSGSTVVVDYSSPNVAKRMHVGHIRSTIIGQALVNIHRALGYHVIGDNHLGDWGKQFGIIIAAMMREGKPQTEDETALEQLEAMYARYNRDMERDPALNDEARRWSLRLEQGDTEARALWQWSVDTTLRANQRNYERLGVQFDHTYGESFYEHMLPDVIAEALDKGVARRDDDGSVVVDENEQEKLPLFLLQRSDGGTLYITRDVATVVFRMREFAPAKIIYIVGAPQELHLRQLFATVRAMGYAQQTDLVHVPFGTISDGQGQALSTRRGNMVYLEQLLNDAATHARTIIEAKNPDLADEEKARVAEAVGVGAVIYNDLYQDTRRNITLDWERMLSTDGNSATYLQYSYARCRSILRRAADDGETLEQARAQANPALLTHEAEQQVLKRMARLPAVVRETARRYAPFVLAEWCYTTAREFAVFFEQCPVLRAETPVLRSTRLLLVAAVAQTLHNGLHLLGIDTPQRM